MISRLVSPILALLLALPPVAGAETLPQAGPDWTPKASDGVHFLQSVQRKFQDKAGREAFRVKVREARAEALKGFSAIDRASGKVLARLHTPETLLQLWILAGVHGAIQIEKLKPLTGQTGGTLDALSSVGDVLVNNFDIYAGLMGGSAVNYGFKPVLENMRTTIASRVSNQVAARFFQTGVATFATFVGWEAGSQLWQEAIFLLDENEIPQAEKLRLLDLLTGKGTPQEYQLLQKVFNNAFEIMTFVHPEQTGMWIANTFRLHLFTGPVLTMALSMAVFGSVAGSVAPGAGNVAGWAIGFAGGLAGGLVYLVIPEPWQNGITDGIREYAIHQGFDHLFKNEIILKQYQRFLLQPKNDMRPFHEKGFGQFLAIRHEDRDFIVTYFMTQIQEYYLRMQEADQILELARQSPDLQAISQDEFLNAVQNQRPEVNSRPVAEIVREYQSKKADAEAHITDYFQRILQLYRDEGALLSAFVYQADPLFPQSARDRAQSALNEVETVYRSMRTMYGAIVPAKAHDLLLPELGSADQEKFKMAAGIFINFVYMRGFQEADLI